MDTSPPDASTSFWVGLGGDDFDGKGYLVQAGIQGTICGSPCGPVPSVQYNMWYEDILDQNHKYGPISLDPNQYPVKAGDSVEVIVDSNYSFANEVYYFIGDISSNAYFGQQFPYPLSNGSTAEWIVESGLKLDRFWIPGVCPSGTPGMNCVSFHDNYVIRNGGTKYIDALPTNAVVMNPYGTQDAFPGPIHNSGSAAFFNTYWQANT